MKKVFVLSVLYSFMAFAPCLCLSEDARSKGFVYIHEVDPSIIISPRYSTSENFLGRPIAGYKRQAIVMTRKTAEALKKVQSAVSRDGYSLVIYDAYRPQRAVDNFVKWSEDISDQVRKHQYYPRVDKAKVFELGYVAKRSGHSRGSTVDLTLIKNGELLHPIQEKLRVLNDGFTITLLDDGTVDMGSSFDLFDKASHFENDVIGEPFKSLRSYLKLIMEKFGFKPYAEEWWHFTLKDEPYASTEDSSYFDFEVD